VLEIRAQLQLSACSFFNSGFFEEVLVSLAVNIRLPIQKKEIETAGNVGPIPFILV